MEREFWMILRFFIKIFVFIAKFVINLFSFIVANIYLYIQKDAIRRRNKKNRNLKEELVHSINEIFSDGLEKNSLISGGNTEIRAEFLYSAISNILNFQGKSVVLLHTGDTDLTSKFQVHSNNRIVNIDSTSPIYDPFYWRSDHEIISLIKDSFPQALSGAAIEYIQGLLLYIRSAGQKPSLEMLCGCPHTRMVSMVNDKVAKGIFSVDLGDEIIQHLVRGQNDILPLQNYFDSLKNECGSILCTHNLNTCYDVQKSISENKILLIDVQSAVNNALLNLIFSQLRNVLSRTNNVKIIIDDLPISSNESRVQDLLRVTRDNLIITSDDLYTMLSGDDKLFDVLVSRSKLNLILAHSNATSANKWSEKIGCYDKAEIDYSLGQHIHWGCSLSGVGNNFHVKNERCRIVKEEEILRMGSSDLFVMDIIANRLVHTSVM